MRHAAMAARSFRRPAIAAILVAALAAVFGLGQLVLPGIAASRLRASLLRTSDGVSVSVSATPAVELLFGQAGSVVVHISTMRSHRGPVGSLIQRASQTTDLDATVGELFVDGLTLRHITLLKQGPRMSIRAFVSRASIASVLPLNLSLRPAAGVAGIQLRSSVDLFGIRESVSARVEASRGRVEIGPDLPLPAGILQVTIFQAPGFSVDHVDARLYRDGYELDAYGHYT
jgi:hypothetical protein